MNVTSPLLCCQKIPTCRISDLFAFVFEWTAAEQGVLRSSAARSSSFFCRGGNFEISFLLIFPWYTFQTQRSLIFISQSHGMIPCQVLKLPCRNSAMFFASLCLGPMRNRKKFELFFTKIEVSERGFMKIRGRGREGGRVKCEMQGKGCWVLENTHTF